MKRSFSGKFYQGLALLALLSLALVSMSTDPGTTYGYQGQTIPKTTARLTIVNRSGLPIQIRFSSSSQGNSTQSYFLSVPSDSTKSFDLVRDRYSFSVTYVQPWDPVYGYSCSSTGSSLNFSKNIRLTVNTCGSRPVVSEPGQVKSGGRGGRGGR